MSKSKDNSSMFASLQGLKQPEKPVIKKEKITKIQKDLNEEKNNKVVVEESENIGMSSVPEPIEQITAEENIIVNAPKNIKSISKKEDKSIDRKVPTSVRIDETLKEQLITISLKRSIEERKRITFSDIVDEALIMYVKKNKDLI